MSIKGKLIFLAFTNNTHKETQAKSFHYQVKMKIEEKKKERRDGELNVFGTKL